MTPEGKVKALVNRRLEQHFGRRCYRFMPVQNGMGAPGLDYHCCIDGLAVYIETKMEGKTLTERQRLTRNRIEEASGLVFEIHNKVEIDAMIARIEWTIQGPRNKTKLPRSEERRVGKECRL